jgi:hypothetical protein
VVGDLEHVHHREPALDEDRVDVFLDITGKQKPPTLEFTEKDERSVVCLPVVCRRGVEVAGALPAVVRPQDLECRVVKLDRLARRDALGQKPLCGERGLPRPICGGICRPARLEGPADLVALDHGHESGHVVVVRMGQQDRVDPPIPRGNVPVELRGEEVRVWTAIDKDAASEVTLEEDGVALANVQDDDVDAAVGSRSDHRPGEYNQERDAGEGPPITRAELGAGRPGRRKCSGAGMGPGAAASAAARERPVHQEQQAHRGGRGGDVRRKRESLVCAGNCRGGPPRLR